MTQAPKALLFDIMDTVVVDPFFDDDFGALFGLQREALYAKMTPDVWLAFERGELSADAYYAQFFRDGSGVDGALLEDWMATRYRWMPGMEALLSDLRDAGVPVYALSNYPVWWKMIERRLGLSAYLEWRFVSCMTGVRKPDPRSYLGPAEALALAPSACLFVDDREGNCAAAREVGMPAHRFETTAALRIALRTSGITI